MAPSDQSASFGGIIPTWMAPRSVFSWANASLTRGLPPRFPGLWIPTQNFPPDIRKKLFFAKVWAIFNLPLMVFLNLYTKRSIPQILDDQSQNYFTVKKYTENTTFSRPRSISIKRINSVRKGGASMTSHFAAALGKALRIRRRTGEHLNLKYAIRRKSN